LEVDLNRISEIAAELDRDAANEVSDMRTRKRKRVKQRPVAGAGKESIATATTEDGKVIEVDIIPDPQFEAMIMHGSDKGMDYLKDKLYRMSKRARHFATFSRVVSPGSMRESLSFR